MPHDPKKTHNDLTGTLSAHWQPLKDLITLVEPPHLRKAMLKWINQNMNCAYSVKTGACQMQCMNDVLCPYDITLEPKDTDKPLTKKGAKNENKVQ